MLLHVYHTCKVIDAFVNKITSPIFSVFFLRSANISQTTLYFHLCLEEIVIICKCTITHTL